MWASRAAERAAERHDEQKLLEMVRDRRPRARLAAVQACGTLGRVGPTLRDALVRAIEDPEPGVRSQAVGVLGLLHVEDARNEIIGALHDEDEIVRMFAAGTLGSMREASAREPLIERLADPSDLVRGAAVYALGMIGDAPSMDAIRRLSETESSSSVITKIGEALGPDRGEPQPPDPAGRTPSSPTG